jgi:hypothetical protein
MHFQKSQLPPREIALQFEETIEGNHQLTRTPREGTKDLIKFDLLTRAE